MWGPIIKFIFTAYTLISFAHGISIHNRLRNYEEWCSKQIEIYGTREEKLQALAGFMGRDSGRLSDIALEAMKWYEKLFVISNPGPIIEGKIALAQLERLTGISDIEKKYCIKPK